MGNPFYRGPYAFGDVSDGPTPPAGNVVGFTARAQDGASIGIMLPQWHELTIDNVIGQAASEVDGGLTIVDGDSYLCEARVECLNNYGQYVVFGYSLNGKSPIELNRAQCNSNDYVFVVTQRKLLTLADGDTIKFYVSSTFEWAQFAWRNLEILAVHK